MLQIIQLVLEVLEVEYLADVQQVVVQVILLPLVLLRVIEAVMLLTFHQKTVL